MQERTDTDWQGSLAEIVMDLKTWSRFKREAAARGYPAVEGREQRNDLLADKEVLFLSGCPRDIALRIKREIRLAADRGKLKAAMVNEEKARRGYR